MTDDSRSPLPDSAPDELDLLASRVLDGDVDPAERARAEADPAVASRRAAMARTRAEMRALPPLDPTITAQAVAAALAVFDTEQGVPATPVDGAPLAPVVPMRPRSRWATAVPWLGAAAAATALVVGMAGLGSSNGGDDLAGSRPADTQTLEAAPEAAPEAASAPDASDATTMSADDGAGVAESGDAPVDESGRIGEDSSDSVVVMSGTDAPAATNAPAAEDQEMTVASGSVTLEDAAALGAFAASAAPIDGVSICAPQAPLIAAEALFGADPATALLVEVVRDTDGEIVAYDLGTCSEAARVPAG